MKIIGLVGTSGSGKTTICDILKKGENATIIDADKIAKKLSKKGTLYFKSIVECFGAHIIDEKGELKRKELAEIIFEDDKKREELNQLTFIYVVDEIKRLISLSSAKEFIVIDAPLLFESNLNQICDFVIGVIAPNEVKVERIMKRDNIEEDLALKRLNIQKDNDFIRENSDFIIENVKDIEYLKECIEEIKEKINIIILRSVLF